MVEKHFCDVCGKETDNEDNVRISTRESEVGVKFDVCSDCLTNKKLMDILIALGEENMFVTINLPTDYWKGGD